MRFPDEPVYVRTYHDAVGISVEETKEYVDAYDMHTVEMNDSAFDITNLFDPINPF